MDLLLANNITSGLVNDLGLRESLKEYFNQTDFRAREEQFQMFDNAMRNISMYLG